MRVLFVGFGMAIYFRDFLDGLVEKENLKIVNVIPRGENKHVGEGVKQSYSETKFTVIELNEILVKSKRIFGLHDFEIRPSYFLLKGLGELIKYEKPDIVVVGVTYFESFYFDENIRKSINSSKAKVVFRSIPFQLQTYEEHLSSIPEVNSIELRSFPVAGSFLKSMGIAQLYARTLRRRTLVRPLLRRKGIFNSCDAHAVYHEEGKSIYESYGVPRNKVFVVRNSPPTEPLLNALRALEERGDNSAFHSTRLIHVGRLVQWKRVDLLIEAVARLRKNGFPDADLIVIGYGPEEENLRRQAKDFGVENCVHFLGGVYDANELASWYFSSAIYVLAGMGGLSINEAMSFKKPIICSRCDGTEKFLVRNGGNGFFFQEGDLEDLVNKIQILFENQGLRQKMGEKSFSIIKNEINFDILLKNYSGMFKKIKGVNF